MTEKNAFYYMVEDAQIKNDSLLVVGLDVDPSKIPREFRDKTNSMFEFSKYIIDTTVDYVCAFKPQVAYWSAVKKSDLSDLDDSAEEQLIATVAYVHDNYPDIPVILDAKRNDIGSTATQYGLEVFDKFCVDAVTINPYLGEDAVNPFLDWTDQGIIILCRTSNPSAIDFQDLQVLYNEEEMPLYEVVARMVFYEWNKSANCCLVMGGIRKGDEKALVAMKTVRELVGDDIMFLVPGIGAQGGDEEITVNAGKDSRGRGMAINSSRGVIYAEDPAKAAIELKEKINQYR